MDRLAFAWFFLVVIVFWILPVWCVADVVADRRRERKGKRQPIHNPNLNRTWKLKDGED